MLAAVKQDETKQIQENLNKWDDLCRLSDEQFSSIKKLQQFNQYQIDDDLNLNLEDNLDVNIKKARTRIRNDSTTKANDLIDLDRINDDVNEMLYNFDINDIEDVKIKNYVELLNNYKTNCNQIYESIQNALNHLQVLHDNYSQVSEKTNSLHNACEQILSDQTKLVNTSDLINSKLNYFTEIDIFIQKLNSPLMENNFEYVIPTLSRIDECYAFLELNKSYKERETYLMILKQALNKALSLIKNQVFNSLNNLANSITIHLQETKESLTLSADNAYTLFYGKFRSNSHRIKALMEQLEQRTDKNIIEYDQALIECHKYYVHQRRMLLLGSIHNAINDLGMKYQRDTCTLVRSSCSFMINLCLDEYKLYTQFFTKPSYLLNNLLEEFCTKLYDTLRPIIIHVVHIETLAELCSILKNEILMDNIKNNAEELQVFEGVCSQLLEDIQERLVYRTHIYIKTEIRDYNPSSGDIAYPEKLETMEKIAAQLQADSTPSTPTKTTTNGHENNVVSVVDETKKDENSIENSLSSIDTLSTPNSLNDSQQVFEYNNLFTKNNHVSPADVHGMWFPTVRRTLICLSKLYRCLDKPIFEGLSQETLSMCVDSLVKAADKITKNKTHLDGELFLIKHLLILREQIAPFNVEFSVKEMQLDFTKIKDAAINLIYKRDKYFKLNRDNAFLDFLLNGTLQVKENFIDSKREVDSHLKKSCELFIKNTSNDLVVNLKSWLDKAQTIVKMNKDTNAVKVSLRGQPFAKADKLHDIIVENYKEIRKKLPKICHLMSIYLSNKDIEHIIFKRIKNHVQQTYQDVQNIVSLEYNDEDKLIIACPTLEQISLLTAMAINK